MTYEQATVWPYSRGSNTPQSSGPLTVRLLHPSNTSRHPVPLGLVVSSSPEPAFLVLHPASGKVTYWESLSAAASADVARQRQQCVRGSVNGMLSGETITSVAEAEPHGFILAFNTGRIAHLSVSDPKGKSLIGVQYLNGSQFGGFLGGLKNVFSSSGWRKDVAAIRAGPSLQRGQKLMVTATIHGVFQVWDLSWNGSQSMAFEADAKNDMLNSLERHRDDDKDKHNFEVLDFTFYTAQENHNISAAQATDLRILVLAMIPGAESASYTLFDLSLINNLATVNLVHPVSSYNSLWPKGSHFRPQVLTPTPSEMAFVVFEKSIALVSLAPADESPHSQLQVGTPAFAEPFQDTINLRQDKDYRVAACAAEPYDRAKKHASCVILVQGVGVIRVVVLPAREGQPERAAVAAKTKIEQAVFFGGLQDNIIDFSGRAKPQFSTEEVENAAMEISDSIMKSSSVHIPKIAPSMDQQLQQRSNALSDLIRHLRKHYQPLSRITRW